MAGRLKLYFTAAMASAALGTGSEAGAAPEREAEAEIVNGLKLTISLPLWDSVIAGGMVSSDRCKESYHLANGLKKCATCDGQCNIAHRHCLECAKRLGVCEVCGEKMKPRGALEVGKPVPVMTRLENAGEKRIYLWDHSSSWGHRRFVFVFTDTETGKRYERIEPVNPSWRPVPWAGALDPGEIREQTFPDVTFGSTPDKIPAGKYRLTVTYSNADDGAKYDRLREAKGRVWTGAVRSNTLEVEIKSPKTDTDAG